ncbi:ribonuclease H-like domain-containing protein [Tanacetum coccineum]
MRCSLATLGWKSVLGFRNNGEVVLEMEDDNDKGYAVEVYKPSSGHINAVGINGKYGGFSVSWKLSWNSVMSKRLERALQSQELSIGVLPMLLLRHAGFGIFFVCFITPLSSATIVYCDNVSAVYLSSNPVQHQRTKHIEIDIHFVRDLVATGQVRVLHVPSRFQYVDIFTKGLPSALFEEFRTSLSVRCPPAPTAGESPSHGFLVLAKVNELLRLLEYYNEGEIWVCGVWTKKDGVGKPFKKIYTVKVEGKSLLNSALGWKSVLGFRNNGEVVLVMEDDNDTGYAVEVYEPSSGHISGVGISDKYVGFSAVSYMETLLLLHESNSIIH